MKTFTPKTFNIAKLKGISEKTVADHLKLYEGYVKNTNLILQKIEDLSKDSEKNAYELAEVQRRFGFEYDGMRNHEIYFEHLSNGAKEISKESELYKSIEYIWGSFDKWLARFKAIAMSRGVGWAILYYDKQEKYLMNAYIGDHELGQLSGCAPVLCLDLWEHAYIADYAPGGKKDYVEDFFTNLNWGSVEKNLNEAL
ncbi:MAG TPA: Fe-Mn family superoxide dismutase [Candidatus Paceibacterota bacterium]